MDKRPFSPADGGPGPGRRRRWLGQAFGALAALCLGAPRAAVLPAALAPPATPQALAQALPAGLAEWLARGIPAALRDPAALRELGARYLETHPDDADLALLWQRFSRGGAHRDDAAMIARIGHDWREGDIAVVGGWVFARTEARYCALLHLAAFPR